MIKRVEISVFPSHLRPIDCDRYIEGHKKVLEAYGVTQVTSAKYDWKERTSTYIVMVEEMETKRMLGGARIQLAEEGHPLPIEMAINELDPAIFTLVKEKAVRGTAEFCGLWNSREVAGYGIGSAILGRVGVAMLEPLNLGSMFILGSPATVRAGQSVGFEVVRSLGINGTFYYPKEDLLATAMIVGDPAAIPGADPVSREAIFSLRKIPVQTTTEKGPKGILEAHYNLVLETI